MTVTRDELIADIAADLNQDHDDATRTLRIVLRSILRAVANGHRVSLGEWGTFLHRHVPAHNVKSPNGTTFRIDDQWKAVFLPGPDLARAVQANGMLRHAKAKEEKHKAAS
ncbi:HU family DNA-binding protein [Nonomuraea sp. NPDC050394]|uniref:HU family DNA-binding protein n=1 Tax=Nonomuraea sp. NPDC050394 TaxID=3364363 RepID=UPI00378834AD